MNPTHFIAVILLAILPGLNASETLHNVLDYGAVSGYGINNTKAIQEAVNACSMTGGKVYFPAGIFMSGTVFLKSDVSIEISENSVWQAFPDQGVFPFIEQNLITRMGPEPRKAMIYAENVENITIEGKGLLYPYGDHEVFQTGKGDDPARPFGILMIHCKNIEIKDLRMQNSAYWMQRYLECTHLRISNITVFNHSNLNNDGCDIDGCKDVVVIGCIIDSSDDALCFKSENTSVCENVTVSNCILRSHASALKWGTGSVGGFRNFTVSNCVISTSQSKEMHHPLRSWIGLVGIDMGNVDGGIMENIIINGITVDGIETPIFIRLGDRNGSQYAHNETLEKGKTQNIQILNVTGTSGGKIPCAITAYRGNLIENVTLSNIHFRFQGGIDDYDLSKEIPEVSSSYPINRMFGDMLPAYGLYLRYVKNINLENILFTLQNDDIRPALFTEEVEDLRLANYRFSRPSGENPEIFVKNSRNFHFYGEGNTGQVSDFIQATGQNSENFRFYNSVLEEILERPVLSGFSGKALCVDISFIQLSWDTNYDDGGTGFFQIYRNGDFLARTQDRSYTDKDVLSGREYRYFLQYTDNKGIKRETSDIKVNALKDRDNPRVEKFNLIDNQTLEFCFSEPLSPSTQVSDINFSSSPGISLEHIILNIAGNRLIATVSPLSPGKNYEISISGLEDTSSEKNKMEKFTTSFIDKPLVFVFNFDSISNTGKATFEPENNGVSGKAGYFKGQDNFIRINQGSATNIEGNMAVSLWFRLEVADMDSYMRLLSCRKSWNSEEGYELEINPSLNRINFCGAAKNADSQGLLEYKFDDNWHHLVALIKDHEALFYIDGEFAGRDSFVAQPAKSQTSLYLGCSGSESDFFKGWLDEVSIYRRALSEDEIQNIFNLK